MTPTPLVRRTAPSVLRMSAIRLFLWSIPIAIAVALAFSAARYPWTPPRDTRQDGSTGESSESLGSVSSDVSGPGHGTTSQPASRTGSRQSIGPGSRPSLGRPGLFSLPTARSPVRSGPSLRALAEAQREKLSLVGIRGGGDPVAILQDRSTGETAEARVGERVHGVEIVEIRDRSVLLSYEGETFQLPL